MSIFQKDCPECTAPNPVDAVSCRCGYCFDPDALARTDPTEYAHQQDRLYRDYLAARIAQAEAELAVARELAKADPENAYKASGALLAEQALNALQAEMRQVSLRVGAAPRRPTPAPIPTRKPVRTLAPPLAKPVVTPPKPAAAKSAPPAAKAAPIRPTTGPSANAVVTRATKPAAPSARPARAQLPTTTAAKPPQTAAPRISAKPNENFKRLQAERAEAIARARTPVAKPPPAPPRHVPAKAAAPRQPARNPAAIPPVSVAAAPALQECPNCTASVPADRQRCGCGYTFSRAAQEVPAITLDAAALAILTEGISATKRSTRGR